MLARVLQVKKGILFIQTHLQGGGSRSILGLCVPRACPVCVSKIDSRSCFVDKWSSRHFFLFLYLFTAVVAVTVAVTSVLQIKKWLFDSRSCFIDKKMIFFFPNASPRGRVSKHFGAVCAPQVSCVRPVCVLGVSYVWSGG